MSRSGWARRGGPQVGEELAEVGDLGCRPGGPGGQSPGSGCRCTDQQLAVVLHRRAAARRVDDDRVHAGRLEGLDHPPGERRRLGRRPACSDSAPQQPCPGDDHLAPLGGEHPGGRVVDPGKNTRCTQPVSIPTTAGARLGATRPAAALAVGPLAARGHPGERDLGQQAGGASAAAPCAGSARSALGRGGARQQPQPRGYGNARRRRPRGPRPRRPGRPALRCPAVAGLCGSLLPLRVSSISRS